MRIFRKLVKYFRQLIVGREIQDTLDKMFRALNGEHLALSLMKYKGSQKTEQHSKLFALEAAMRMIVAGLNDTSYDYRNPRPHYMERTLTSIRHKPNGDRERGISCVHGY